MQAGGRPEAASGREVHPDGEVCCEEVEALQSFQPHSSGGPGTGTNTLSSLSYNWLHFFFMVKT